MFWQEDHLAKDFRESAERAGTARGVLPFLVGDVVKSALGAATLALWHSARTRLLGT